MFKKTLVAAALATATMGASAYQIGHNNDFNVEVYGVVATSAVNYNVTGNDTGDQTGTTVENETRIGFRAGKEMFDGFTVFMQVESGYVGNMGGPGASGGLGVRDTFVGIKGESWGQLRLGRVLTPLYEIVDWPFSNPGLGNTFDWGGINANYDRQSDQLRYDATFGSLAVAASVGNGDRTRDGAFYGASLKYTIADMVTLIAAGEAGTKSATSSWGWKDHDEKPSTPDEWKETTTEETDQLSYALGFDAALPAGFGLAALYKVDEKSNSKKQTQDSYSIVGSYWNGPLGFRLGYAEVMKSEIDGAEQGDDNSTISGQVMGNINGFVPYLRVAGRTKGEKDTDIVTRVGLEYGF